MYLVSPVSGGAGDCAVWLLPLVPPNLISSVELGLNESACVQAQQRDINRQIAEASLSDRENWQLEREQVHQPHYVHPCPRSLLQLPPPVFERCECARILVSRPVTLVSIILLSSITGCQSSHLRQCTLISHT